MSQATFANTNFCTVSDVTGFYTNSDLLMMVSANSSNIDSKIQNHINNEKDIYLRQPLIQECQRKFPTRIDEWRAQTRAQIDSRLQEYKRNAELADKAGKMYYGGYIGYGGQFFDLDDFADFIKPGTFYFSGIPVDGTSGTYNGKADTGDVLFNTLTDLGYINRGTKASPVWQSFRAGDGIDFILNPEELKWSAVFATGILMSGDGMFRNRVNYQDPVNVNFSATAKEICERDFNKAMKVALDLIDFNISGSGTMTAYELQVAGAEIVLF